MKKSGLADSPLFKVPSTRPDDPLSFLPALPENNPKSQPIKKPKRRKSMTSWHHETLTPRYHDTMTPSYHSSGRRLKNLAKKQPPTIYFSREEIHSGYHLYL